MAKQDAKAAKTAKPAAKQAVVTSIPEGDKVTPRLATKYKGEVIAALTKEFGYSNVMMVPRLQKVVINFGLGEATQNPKVVDRAVEQLTAIAGQKPQVTRARTSIANFKLREGQQVGAKVTLRRERMWEFLDRLFTAALPRVRDFRGISPKGFDGRGNFTMGLK
jgi:large subunit ribosomal protein L5